MGFGVTARGVVGHSRYAASRGPHRFVCVHLRPLVWVLQVRLIGIRLRSVWPHSAHDLSTEPLGRWAPPQRWTQADVLVQVMVRVGTRGSPLRLFWRFSSATLNADVPSVAGHLLHDGRQVRHPFFKLFTVKRKLGRVRQDQRLTFNGIDRRF